MQKNKQAAIGNEQMIWSLFHKSQMERVKTECKGVTFIAHVQEKGRKTIQVRLKNKTGGSDVVTFPLNVSPQEIDVKEYDFIIEVINKREYEASGEVVQ